MNRKALVNLVCLLASAILVACGPSQAELDAQATQSAADEFATQTAEAPAPTLPPTVALPPTPTLPPTPLPTVRPTSTRAATATPTGQPIDTTPSQTPTKIPTIGLPVTSTPTPTPLPVTAAPTAVPATAAPTAVPPTAAPPPPPPPSSGVVATFLADARQTRNDLMEVSVWFNRLAGGETIPCSTVFAHGIHLPSSMAPAQVPDLVPIWNEYQGAIADGQQCLQSLKDFCAAGGGSFGAGDFWARRDLSSSALSRGEHVVQALEAK